MLDAKLAALVGLIHHFKDCWAAAPSDGGMHIHGQESRASARTMHGPNHLQRPLLLWLKISVLQDDELLQQTDHTAQTDILHLWR